MKLYRFSPIQDYDQLLVAISFIHFACHQLCKQSFGQYLANAGNMGVFCHYDDEHTRLVEIRNILGSVVSATHYATEMPRCISA